MAQKVLERTLRGRTSRIVFECPSCCSVLSVPEAEAGVSGPCPLCGGHVDSPMVSEARFDHSASFVSKRPPVPPLRLEPLPKLRPEGRLDWRERRERWHRLAAWIQRSRARLSVGALAVTAALLAFMYSYGWNLPWTLEEDSMVLRIFDSLQWGNGGGEGGALPTGPRRQ